MGGLRSCMGLTGCATIEELRTKAEFVRISGAGIKESHVHDVILLKKRQNYRMGLIDKRAVYLTALLKYFGQLKGLK